MNGSGHDRWSELESLFTGSVLFDEPIAAYTSIRVGGPADIFFTPKELSELRRGLDWAQSQEMPVWVIGAGSNLLIRDGGLRGFVVSLKNLNHFERTADGRIYAEAGVFVPKLVEWTAEQSLSGLEPLIGVPGSVGGAIVMNAGTRDGEIGNAVDSAVCLVKGKETTLNREALQFSYRSAKVPKGAILLSAILNLRDGNREEIEKKIRAYKEYRLKTQPLNHPNLGSVFKNPPKGASPKGASPKGHPASAGEMIEEAGLKDVRIGKARISPKHANFIINEGGATARDIQRLIGLIRDKVKEKFGVLLEPEVRIIGEEVETTGPKGR